MSYSAFLYTGNASSSFLCPQPTLSRLVQPSQCFPTWQRASLNSGWQALTRLQYKWSCRKWHQLRWRTKTLWLQSRNSFLHRRGFTQPRLTTTTTSGEEKAQTTKTCQASSHRRSLSFSGVFSTKPDQESSSLIIAWTMTATSSTSYVSYIPAIHGELNVLCSLRLRDVQCTHTHLCTHSVEWNWFVSQGFWQLPKDYRSVHVFPFLSFNFSFVWFSLFLLILVNCWSMAVQHWQRHACWKCLVFEEKKLRIVGK